MTKHEIQVRLPKGSNYKQELQKIADRNHISMNALMVKIICWFLESIEKGVQFKFTLK